MDPGDFMRLLDIVAIVVGIVAVCSRAQSQTYQSVQLDSAGQLSITLSSGAVLRPPKLQDQVSFSQPLISANHQTIAWLANYADPSAPQGSSDRVAGRLVLYRKGHVFRSFHTDQIFWSWQFVNQDRDIAFCTGPTHGGASGCELHRVDSGHLQARWDTHSLGDPPLWVQGLD
jgi:hypothetical protein